MSLPRFYTSYPYPPYHRSSNPNSPWVVHDVETEEYPEDTLEYIAIVLYHSGDRTCTGPQSDGQTIPCQMCRGPRDCYVWRDLTIQVLNYNIQDYNALYSMDGIGVWLMIPDTPEWPKRMKKWMKLKKAQAGETHKFCEYRLTHEAYPLPMEQDRWVIRDRRVNRGERIISGAVELR